MDIGSCLCLNLRQGMFIAYIIQTALTAINIMVAQTNLNHPQMGIFFFAKGLELNGFSMILWVTGVVTMAVGFASLFKISGAGTVKLWLLLSFFLAPLQLCAGSIFSYRCLLIYQDFTPSLVAINSVITYAVQSNMPAPPAEDKAETKKDVVAAFKDRFESAADFEHSFFQKANELDKPKPPRGFFGKLFSGVSSWFQKKAEGFRVWRKKRSSWIKAAFGGTIIIGALIFSSVFDESETIYQILPEPMKQYYKSGMNFMVTFLRFGLLYPLVYLIIAIHISAYHAVKARGGTGEEFVGYRKIRWFYNQTPENRRKIRAGGQLHEQRLEGSDPDSDDSGSDLESYARKDDAAIVAVSTEIHAKKLIEREKRRKQI